MSSPRVLNMRGRHGIVQAGAVYIGREVRDRFPGRPVVIARSKWANDFQIGKHGTREEVIASYRAWLAVSPNCWPRYPSCAARIWSAGARRTLPRRRAARAGGRAAMKRDLRALLDDARRRGWSVDRTRSDHWRLRHPSGAIVYSGSTPSCPRLSATPRPPSVGSSAAACRRRPHRSTNHDHGDWRMQPTTVPFVHSGYARRLNDHYPTIDPRCVQALVETWRIDGPIVDPCAPNGSGIVEELCRRGYDAKCADSPQGLAPCGWLVTNPPYDRRVVDKLAWRMHSSAEAIPPQAWRCSCGPTGSSPPVVPTCSSAPSTAGRPACVFRPWWTDDRNARPIHSFVWHVWSWGSGEPVLRFWPLQIGLLL